MKWPEPTSSEPSSYPSTRKSPGKHEHTSCMETNSSGSNSTLNGYVHTQKKMSKISCDASNFTNICKYHDSRDQHGVRECINSTRTTVKLSRDKAKGIFTRKRIVQNLDYSLAPTILTLRHNKNIVKKEHTSSLHWKSSQHISRKLYVH